MDILKQQEYVNSDTGEVEVFDVIKRNGDFNFEKIWLGHMIDALEIIGNQKIKVILHLLENRIKSNNMFLGTQREISKDVGVSIQTVSSTIKALKEANMLKEIRSGTYQLNPDFIFKGQNQKRMKILLDYNNV